MGEEILHLVKSNYIGRDGILQAIYLESADKNGLLRKSRGQFFEIIRKILTRKHSNNQGQQESKIHHGAGGQHVPQGHPLSEVGDLVASFFKQVAVKQQFQVRVILLQEGTGENAWDDHSSAGS